MCMLFILFSTQSSKNIFSLYLHIFELDMQGFWRKNVLLQNSDNTYDPPFVRIWALKLHNTKWSFSTSKLGFVEEVPVPM